MPVLQVDPTISAPEPAASPSPAPAYSGIPFSVEFTPGSGEVTKEMVEETVRGFRAVCYKAFNIPLDRDTQACFTAEFLNVTVVKICVSVESTPKKDPPKK